ncbi:MAG: tRNA uridine-5-carboxymethylaminomethyl(34) synthesis GTPase MnmE [bacterium]
MYNKEDTIAAISTPKGSGGIAVIRINGSSAISIVDKIFQGKVRLLEAESHKAYLGKIVMSPQNEKVQSYLKETTQNVEFLDEIIVTLFRAPNSYTRENIVEIGCHGGQFISHRILELLLEQGARLAQPGEFTQRAFLNGRLDLSQAEAVADIIRAKTELSLKTALTQYQGALSRRIKNIRQGLIEICSLLELELDFAEEDIEFADRAEVERKLKNSIEEIRLFLSTYERGKILREGAKVAIIGRPNVGKSSLLNALLKEERAIVTEIPGTTRDVLEEQLDIRGVLFRVVDTAGIRPPGDKVEQEGVRRTENQIKDADIILLIFDGSAQLNCHDLEIINHVFTIRKHDKEIHNGFVGLINKIDLEQKLTRTKLNKHLGNGPILEISAKEHLGFKKLEEILIRLVLGNEGYSQDKPLLTSIRHKQALNLALESLQAGLNSLARGLSSEFVALDLRAALEHLGEIIGEVTTEDILNNIFSKYCIGK